MNFLGAVHLAIQPAIPDKSCNTSVQRLRNPSVQLCVYKRISPFVRFVHTVFVRGLVPIQASIKHGVHQSVHPLIKPPRHPTSTDWLTTLCIPPPSGRSLVHLFRVFVFTSIQSGGHHYLSPFIAHFRRNLFWNPDARRGSCAHYLANCLGGVWTIPCVGGGGRADKKHAFKRKKAKSVPYAFTDIKIRRFAHKRQWGYLLFSRKGADYALRGAITRRVSPRGVEYLPPLDSLLYITKARPPLASSSSVCVPPEPSMG